MKDEKKLVQPIVSKKKTRKFSFQPVRADHPIYSAGYLIGRPLRGTAPQNSLEQEQKQMPSQNKEKT